jgi:small subunit ribosomal protein S2
MKPYIYGSKNKIHIIDLQKTAKGLEEADRFLQATTARGGSVLFVGTKRSARDIIQEQATRCGMYYVTNRWLGGTLTNWQTVKKSIERLLSLEKARDEGRFELLTKKESLDLQREIIKMDKNLGGIKAMKGVPAAVFIIDPHKEHIATREAQTLGIPIVAVCDTNCDPDGIDYVIPGNDDALKAIRLYATLVADSIVEGKQKATGRAAESAYVSSEQDDAVEVIHRHGSTEAPAEEAVAEEAVAEEAAPAEEAAAAEEPAAAEEAVVKSTEAATDTAEASP